MLISFFEEFPNETNLNKLNLIKFKTNLYIAAKNITEFEKIKKKIKNKNVCKIIYWPILKKKEGYWISPFSKRNALLRILKELESNKYPIMLDLELPTTRNIFLFITELINFIRNKKLIQKFINNYSNEVYLCEYYPTGRVQQRMLYFLGLDYKINKKKDKIIKMLYHSMHKYNINFIIKEIKESKKEFHHNFILSYGTIAKGITNKEKIMLPNQLKSDLLIARKLNLDEVIIFRLGGLNKEYLKIINQFH